MRRRGDSSIKFYEEWECARDLGYAPHVLDMIKEAKSQAEAQRILVEARRNNMYR